MVSLYLKYRPLCFDDIVDQEMPKRALRNAVALGKTSHAYLFCGPRGTGKTSMARILAKALVCAAPTAEGNPCTSCACCTAVQEGSLVDIIEIDAASNRGIDEIRALKERIHFAPTQATKKVYIIDEVHMLTKDAFNALLKTLEEPPAHVHFILATTEIHKVLDTIISRCQRYDFRRITDEAVTDRLAYIAQQEHFPFAREALALIALASRGGLRDAIRSLEQLSHTEMYALEEVQRFLGHAGMSRIDEFLDLLLQGNLSQVLALITELYQNGVHMRELCKELLFAARSRMMADITAGTMKQVPSYMRLLELLDQAKDQLRATMIEQLPIEIACISFCQPEVAVPVVSAPIHAVPQPSSAKPIIQNTTQSSPAPVRVPPIVKTEIPEEIKSESPQIHSTPTTPTRSIIDDLFSSSAVVDTKEPTAPEDIAQEPVQTTPSVVATGVLPELAHVQQEWKKFCMTVTKSSVKFCLREGRPMAVQDGRLQVVFSTRFSLDKVMEVANKEVVHTALREFFGYPLEIYGEVQGNATQDVASSTPGSEDVLSVFGGSTML